MFVVPPLPRGTPYWYRRYFTSISSCFAEAFKHTEDGILVLPTFTQPDYERDGIHFTENDGPRYAITTFIFAFIGYATSVPSNQ